MMELRLAVFDDLPKLKVFYAKIVEMMIDSGIRIWDDVYPVDFLAADIERERLYVLTSEDGVLLGAFALAETNAGEAHVEWERNDASAVYLERLGVSVDHVRQGIATALVDRAKALARERSAEYLRLFVVETNRPAVSLYLKNGFTRAKGEFVEVIAETLVFHETGFETKL